MSAATGSQTPTEELPFVAPCNELPTGAPFQWLARAWRDMRAAPALSLFYGAMLTLLSAVIAALTWRSGLIALYLGLATGFVFIGPWLAMGLYSISYQLEVGRQPTLAYTLRQVRAHMRDTLVLGICLLILLLVWARAATLLNVLRPETGLPNWRDLLPFLAIGSGVGAIFAAIVFAASAFSLPMLLDRRTDAITAVVTSINATLRNKLTMFIWAMLIVVSVAIGFATFLIGFIVLMPLIGHASWHAYRAAIDATMWPRVVDS